MRQAALSLLLGLAALGAAGAQPSAADPAPPLLDQIGVSPGGPVSESDRALDDRIRSSVNAAESLQGPLDGSWTLYDAVGGRLYVFQVVDPAGGQGPLEGVWRDLRRPAGSLAYGLVTYLSRGEGGLTIGFTAAARVSIVLRALSDGAWSGEMTENGAKTAVVLRRR